MRVCAHIPVRDALRERRSHTYRQRTHRPAPKRQRPAPAPTDPIPKVRETVHKTKGLTGGNSTNRVRVGGQPKERERAPARRPTVLAASMCMCSMCICSMCMCMCSMCICSMCMCSMCMCSMCMCSMCMWHVHVHVMYMSYGMSWVPRRVKRPRRKSKTTVSESYSKQDPLKPPRYG